MTKIIYHPLAASEYEQIIEVWQKSGLPVKPEGRDSYENISRQIEKTPDFCIGAYADKVLVGLVLATSDGRKGWINRLAVIPELRGNNIARTLIRRAEKVLRETGLQIIACLILDDNQPSIKLFQSEGYSNWSKVLYFRKAFDETI